MPWNLRDEIAAQLDYVREWGGKLVVALPELEDLLTDAEGAAMKVVLFCGGLGHADAHRTTESLPKPMMPIGSRPVLWHVMRYYAHFGHTEFILCLGYGAAGGQGLLPRLPRDRVQRLRADARAASTSRCSAPTSATGRITFIDTGIDTAIGERLRRVRPYLEDDEIFLANYGDVLTDAPMDDLIDEFADDRRRGAAPRGEAAGLLPRRGHRRRRPGHRPDAGRRHVHAHQRRLLRAAAGHLRLPRTRATTWSWTGSRGPPRTAGCARSSYDGFWAPMDTLKERTALEEQYRQRDQPVGRCGATGPWNRGTDPPGRDAGARVSADGAR